MIRSLGIRARFTLAIAGTVALAVLGLVIAVGAFGTMMLRSTHDVALQREANRVVSLLNTNADYVASGSCAYSTEPACTVVIDADTPVGRSMMGLSITNEQLALTRDAGQARDDPDGMPQTAEDSLWSDATIRSEHGPVAVRVLTLPLADGRALVTASPTEIIDRAVSRLVLILVLAGTATVFGAAVVSALVAARTVRPILRLTDAAEHVVGAGDPTGRVALPRRDELGRLSVAIDDMLARLDLAEAARRHLIEDASHDLRSPLTALSTNLELLERDALPPELRERLLTDARHETADMARLVHNITDLATAVEARLPVSEYSPSRVVEDAVGAARRRWHRTEFMVEARLPHQHQAVGDHDLLVRVVLNLLDNSAKYGPADGVVRIEAGEDDDTWWVSVADDGPGIPADALPHVFDRSYRVDRSVRQPGSGIGLAMAKQTAERLGGTLTATSAAASAASPTSGTTMRLRLPLVNIQVDHGKAKPYQVRQVLAAIDKLEGEHS
ncbi:HAMP domain-containing sensor histidine kinase [Plantibacter sp. YIM 135347]|uniref:sensor histidine kinase n=1 Tax=Plantibacter sp. YIM 135347 TaxID=3423919 RepID=UPI003D3399CC